MVAYSFKRRFIDPIVEGVKVNTIRLEGRKRHARPGEELQLYFGQRTKHCRLIARKQCAATLPVSISLLEDEVVVGGDYPWVTDVRMSTASEDGIAFIGWLLYRPDDLDPFARRDGFSDWEDMKAFWFEEHGKPCEGDLFFGKLIGWWQ